MADRIPISRAQDLAKAHGYEQIIIYARRTGEPGLEWVTTYGIDKTHCAAAARIGDAIGRQVVKPLEELTARAEAAEDARDEALTLATRRGADTTYQGKLLRRLRDTFVNIADGIEDEGDRCYFGSSNDADQFRDIVRQLDDFSWDEILRDSGEVDYVESSRKANASLARLVEALTPSGETKAAYIGEFHFDVEDRDADGEDCLRRVTVPWTTVKEIMATIRARAAAGEGP